MISNLRWYSCHSSYVIRFVGKTYQVCASAPTSQRMSGLPSRAHDQDILWFEVAMNYLSDLSGKVSTSSPEAPDAQGQHADANSWPSLSRGPCGNAYMQFLRVYAWIRASDDSHRRKHIRSTNVIHVSAKVLNINDVNDVNDINVKVREAVRIDFEPTTWQRKLMLRHLEEISGPRPKPGSSFPCKSAPWSEEEQIADEHRWTQEKRKASRKTLMWSYCDHLWSLLWGEKQGGKVKRWNSPRPCDESLVYRSLPLQRGGRGGDKTKLSNSIFFAWKPWDSDPTPQMEL